MAVAFASLIVPAGASAAITEYDIPTAASTPTGITTGPDGALWFTEHDVNAIGRLTTTGSFTEYPLNPIDPFVPPKAPEHITPGPDGALWFAERYSGRIGRITTGGALSEFQTPSRCEGCPSGPEGIVAAPDGALWFTELDDDAIGRITTGGALSEFQLAPASGPLGIAVGPDGALWFTEGGANKIGRMTTAGVLTDEFPIPTPVSDAEGIAAGSDGALWFVESRGNKVGRITTGGAITEFPLPLPGFPGTSDITPGPPSDPASLWFTEQQQNKVARIPTSATQSNPGICEFVIPSPTFSSGPVGIVAGPDGALWFTEGHDNQIGRITAEAPPGSLTLSPKNATNAVGRGHTVTATVTSACSGGPAAGVTVRFSVSGANTTGGTATTDGNGQASFSYTGTNGGSDTISAFADQNDNGTQDPTDPGDTAQKLWFTKLASGAFVIGDQNATVGTPVTFSGTHWSKLNSLSGGPAPSSFQGFAARTGSNPPACGQGWSTDTGTTSGAPSTVPAFIAVIAASSITKSGSTISGNAPKVVVVQTNPGYGSDGGHMGTGRVVGTVCGG